MSEKYNIATYLAQDIKNTLIESGADVAMEVIDASGKPAVSIGPEVMAVCDGVLEGNMDRTGLEIVLASGKWPMRHPFRFSDDAVMAAGDLIDVPADKLTIKEGLKVLRRALA